MKKYLLFFLLFFFSFSIVAMAAAPLTIYVNNKNYNEKTYICQGTIYVDAGDILTFLGINNLCTGTEIVVEDLDFQDQLYGMAVWVDFNDGRGKIIALPLNQLAEIMGGRYTYYDDTRTVDVVTFTRTGTPETALDQDTTEEPPPTSAVGPGGAGGVNPFNTSKILYDAQNAVDDYEEKF